MILSIVVARVVLYYRFRKVLDGPFAGEHWKNVYLILALLSGTIWGLSSLIIFPAGRPELISLFVLVIASLSAATTVSHSSIRLAPAAWAGPAMLLYTIRCFMEGGQFGDIAGFLIILYLFTILRYSFTHNSSITSAIELRFENLELLEKLRRAEDEWERNFDSAPDLLTILDDQHRIVRANRAMADRLRMRPEECIGLKCYEVVHGAREAPEFCPHALTCRDGLEHMFEVDEPRLGGEFLVSTTPRFDEQGRFVGTIHVARDITERKRAEKALRVSHAFLDIAHRHEDLSLLIEEFIKEVKGVTQCRAVAIRVSGEDGQNVYEACDGLQQPLSVIDAWLSHLVDISNRQSSPKECEGNSRSIVAHNDSFFHNEASIVAGASPTEPGTTNGCELECLPYESIGRVSIRSRDRLIGFIYAVDERKSLFSQDLADLLGRAAMQMGAAIQRALAVASLKVAHQELEERVRERTQALLNANDLLADKILELRRVEKDLREESAFREAVIAHATEGLLVWHPIEEVPHIRFTVWNHRMEEITGFSMEEINQRGWIETMYDDAFTQAKVRESVKRLLEGEALVRQDRLIHRADGQRRTVIISSCMIPGLDNPKHVIAMVQDVTDLRAAVRALRESEAQFRGLVENIKAGVLILQDGRVVYQNPEQMRLFADFPTPFQPQDMIRFVHPDDQPLFRELVEPLSLPDQPPPEIVCRFNSCAGGDRTRLSWISCRSSATEYRGAPANLITMMDVTELKTLERQVMLREKMASLGHVAAGIAHEIRNPLSGINVYLDAIRENFQDPDSAEDVLQLIQEAQATSNKIELVIRRVADFSRPTDLRLQPTSINKAIHEALKLAAAGLRKASINLVLELDESLPQVYADIQLIEQVMLNLVTNATRILSKSHGKRDIRISTSRQQRDILMRVEDSGPGISQEMREKVFEPFFTTGSQGMGIGLGICRRIIADHKGEISISASPLGGAQFNILIPIEKRKGTR
jgi:PAS domain S-box-containing protein